MERAGSRKEENVSGTRGSLSWLSDGRAGRFRPEFRGSLSDVGGGLREVRGTPMPTGSQRGSRGAGRVARGFPRRAQRPVAWGSGVRETAVGQAGDEGKGKIAEGFAVHPNVTEAPGASRDHTALNGAP